MDKNGWKERMSHNGLQFKIRILKPLLFVTFFSILISGCVTNPYFVLKNHHFDTSETRGERFKFSASLTPYADVTTAVATVTASSTDPQLQSWQIVKNDRNADDSVDTAGGLDHSSLLFSLSLHEKLDLSVDFPLGDQPTFLTAKYQIYGPSRKASSEGAFSAAMFLGAGLIAVESDDLDFFPGAIDTAQIDGQAVRAGISLGIRTNPELLIYWSNSYAHFFTDTKYERNLGGGTVNQTKFRFDGNQILTMLGAQYIHDDKIFANLEYGYVFADSSDADSERYTSLGINLGYFF